MVVVAVVVLCGGCRAGAQRWTTTDKIAEGVFAVALSVDYLQTRLITDDCIETNPVIGKCGERMPIESYFATALLGHALAAHYLPGRLRSLFQGVTIGFAIFTADKNHTYGYRIGFGL